MVGWYERSLIPPLTHLAMRNRRLLPYRRRALAEAEGAVLEIGIGSGLNLPLYGPHVRRVIGVDPSAGLLRRAARAGAAAPVAVDLLRGSAESLPLPDASIDVAVTTWSLCTIPDPGRALTEVRRVLRPTGRLVFVEHGLAADEGVARWQRRLTPLWRRCAGGCHLDRPMAELVAGAGFALSRLHTGYLASPRLLTFMYEGIAAPR